jgi:lysophospholipid acyltransferase (LPLAT)-like uncharacterized protein
MKKKVLFWLGVHMSWWIFLLLCKTLRFKYVRRDVIHSLGQQKKNYVLAFWHGCLLTGFYLHRREKMHALISPSNDGEILARVLERWGYVSIRGSSSKGGKEAMQLMTDSVTNGAGLCITPDGPRGPRHKMKMGAVRVAQKTQVPLVLLSLCIEKKEVLKNWDRFEIPYPFSRAAAVYSDPIWVDGVLEGEPLDRLLAKVEGKMLELDKTAELALKNS